MCVPIACAVDVSPLSPRSGQWTSHDGAREEARCVARPPRLQQALHRGQAPFTGGKHVQMSEAGRAWGG